MSRDRLAGLRAQQGGGGQGQQQAYGNPYDPPQQQQQGYGGGYNGGYQQQPQPGQYGNQGYGGNVGGGGYGDQYGQQQQGGYGQDQGGYQQEQKDTFFDEVRDIGQAVTSLTGQIQQIQTKHREILEEADTTSSRHEQLTQELQGMSSDTSRMSNTIKSRVKSLETDVARLPPGQSETNMKRTQVNALKSRFLSTIQDYQKVEQESRQRIRARMERQYRIVKPDATEEEIRQAVENGPNQQVFSQALANSSRYQDARSALTAAQSRHEEIQKIERTLTELAQLFQEVSTMVQAQDEQIQHIQTTAAQVEDDVKNAEGHIQKAVKSARAARKKRIICFFIILIIIIVVAVVVAVKVVQNNNNNNNGGNNNNPAPTATSR